MPKYILKANDSRSGLEGLIAEGGIGRLKPLRRPSPASAALSRASTTPSATPTSLRSLTYPTRRRQPHRRSRSQ
jgi:hypothetical protein